MKKITGISLLLILLTSSCSSIKYFRYISKGKAPKGIFRTEIPFEMHNNLIVIKARLNDSDKEFEFMVDSGAPVSVIYKETLEASKAETVMTFDVRDSQGNITKSEYVMLDVGIENLVFKDIFTAYSAEPTEVIYCIAPGGIIGADLMQTANWQIDFANKKIIVSDLKSSLPDLKDYQKASFAKRAPFGSMPWLTVVPGLNVDLTIKEVLFTDVLIDLGSSGGLTLPKNAVTDTLFKNDLKQVRMGYSTFGLLGANLDTTVYYRSPDIYMEGINFNRHTIDIAHQSKSRLIGIEILSDYTVFIDFRKNNLYLKPVAVEQDTIDEKSFGFTMLYDSKSSNYYVSSLYEGSSAALSGLQLNDTIVAINQQKMPVFTTYCAFNEWKMTMNLQDQWMIKTTRDDQLIHLEKGIIPRR